MVDANLAALLALPVLALVLVAYLTKIDNNVGHLFLLLGLGLCVIASFPYILNTPSDLGVILAILGLGCVAWGLTLRRKRFRPKKKQF
jgi:FtsH-binding integral membrane protein